MSDQVAIERIVIRQEIRGVVADLNGGVSGYQIRLQHWTPGVNGKEVWTPWFFVSDPNLMELMQHWQQYAETHGHLKGPSTPYLS